jgi:hypothetical protein
MHVFSLPDVACAGGGGGGLVRTLGGMHKAKKVLEETQGHLEELKKDCIKCKESVQRLSGSIEWAWVGGWDSLGAKELLVQEGHVRCAKDAYVALASRCVHVCAQIFLDDQLNSDIYPFIYADMR